MGTREREGDLILRMIVNGDERLNEGGFLGGIVLGMEREKEGEVLSLLWFSSIMN